MASKALIVSLKRFRFEKRKPDARATVLGLVSPPDSRWPTEQAPMFSKLEKKHHPLATRWRFFGRVAGHIGVAMVFVGVGLFLGALGYHYFGGVPWIDSLHNAAMILSGMGPVCEMTTVQGKLFSTFYALFSGIAFLGLMGIVLTPFYHRMLHQFHLDQVAGELEQERKNRSGSRAPK